jgi:hypothetical protein
MSKDGKAATHRIDQFLLGPGGRADDWRDLVEAAKSWAAGVGDHAKYEVLLNELAVTEEFHGYPGLQLMAALKGKRRCRRCRDIIWSFDPDHASADDPLIPTACGRLERSR